MVWHIDRAEDALVSAVDGKSQLWVEQGWHQKFGMASDPELSGYRRSAKDLDSFKVPSVDVLKCYCTAAENMTKEYIGSLSPADLDKKMPAMEGEGTTPLAAYLQIIVNEAIVHDGQVAYLRGLHRGLGCYF